MHKSILLGIIATILITGSLTSLQNAYAIPLTLKSGINGNVYIVQGTPGTAGTLGTDYALGTYLAGGNGGISHGYGNAYSYDTNFNHFIGPLENGYVSTPAGGFNPTGALEDTDHNWLQGTTTPIIVDLGAGNQADQAIVFNSIDHLGVSTVYGDPDKDFWNGFVEGIEFTVYGTDNLADAMACAATANGFGTAEAGTVPGLGSCSTFEKGTLDYVFIDGWADFVNTYEGDDYASVWQFSSPHRYIAVYSDNTDPIIGDGFQSLDNELDAIGRFLTPVGQPCQNCVIGGELLPIDTTALVIAGIQGSALWMLPTLGAVASVGFGLFYLQVKRKH